jgi:hypothetical protein
VEQQRTGRRGVQVVVEHADRRRLPVGVVVELGGQFTGICPQQVVPGVTAWGRFDQEAGPDQFGD